MALYISAFLADVPGYLFKDVCLANSLGVSLQSNEEACLPQYKMVRFPKLTSPIL